MKTKNKTEKIKNENKTKDVASMVVRVEALTQVSVWARINPYVGLGYDKGYLLRAGGVVLIGPGFSAFAVILEELNSNLKCEKGRRYCVTNNIPQRGFFFVIT